MKSNSFGLFKARHNKDLITKLEEQYDVQLPEVFKVFNETFIIESLKSPSKEIFYHPERKAGFYEIENSIEDLFESYKSGFYQTEYHHDLFPFATSQNSLYGICVGLTGSIRDKICISREIDNWEVTVINENIFEFISDLKLYNYSEKKQTQVRFAT